MDKKTVKNRARAFIVALSVAVLALSLALSAASCIRVIGVQGSGRMVSEERNVSGFNSVAISGGMNLYLEQGETENCRIEAEDNIIKRIVTEVKNGKLTIRYGTFLGGISNFQRVNVYLTVKNLNVLQVSSGVMVQSSEISGEGIKILLSSGANGDMVVNTTTLAVTLSSGSQIKISGKATNQVVELSSGVNYNAASLASKNADLSVSSGAQAYIDVSDNLEVSISSGGGVEYTGNPQVTSNISSGGVLRSKSQ